MENKKKYTHWLDIKFKWHAFHQTWYVVRFEMWGWFIFPILQRDQTKKKRKSAIYQLLFGKCYHFVVGWSFYFHFFFTKRKKKKLIGWYYKTKDFDFDSTFPVQIKHWDDWLENSNNKKKWDIVLCYWVVNKGIYRKSV